MPKPTSRLILCYDGTNNNPKDNTNVWRTYDLIAPLAASVPQLKKYIEGVGNQFGRRARGSIFGDGVAQKMCEGYTWLADHYEEGSEIYVFGFSRGAFTARSLVQMVASCGLTQKSAAKQWTAQQAFAYYEACSRDDAQPIWRLAHWRRHPAKAPPGWTPNPTEARLLDESKIRIVKVTMAGLWDTVGAIGTDAIANRGALTQKSAAYNVRPTKALLNGYHAIAIDEHRPMFDVTLWRTFVEAGKVKEAMNRYAPYYEQRWFIGAHSDVGGGYDDNRLPDYSLAWMHQKARALGLGFTRIIEPQPEGWRAPVHDSFKSFARGILNLWSKILPGDQRKYRQICRIPRSVTTAEGIKGELWSINEQIDESVIQRWKSDRSYRPRSLLNFIRRNPGNRLFSKL